MPKYVSDNRHFFVNDVRTNNHEHIIAFFDLCQDAGWTFLSSSNATTVTTASRNDSTMWNNTNAWELWRDPGDRDLVIQRGSSSQSWRGYVGKAGFPFIVGPGGTAATAPTGSNTQIQFIGSSDNFVFNFFPFTENSIRVHMMVDATPRGSTEDVFEFYLHTRNSGGGGGSHGSDFARHAISSPTSGSATIDVEPWIVRGNTFTTSTGHGGWFKAGLSGETRMTSLQYTTISTVNWGTNPYNDQRDIGPYFCWDNTASFLQRKGFLEALFVPTGLESDLDTYNLSEEGKSLVRFGSAAIVPWPHDITPIIP